MNRIALSGFLSILLFACSSNERDQNLAQSDSQLSTSHHATDSTSSTTEVGTYTITTDSIVLKSKRPRYEVHALFPKLEGGSDPALLSTFNSAVRDSVQKNIDEFVSWVDESADEVPLPQDEEMYSAFELSYEIRFQNERGISLGLDNYTQYAGAAHPNTFTTSIIFDFRSGRFLQLDDLFLPDAEYLELIADRCRTELMRREISDESWINEGAGQTIENYQTFFLTQDSLLIYFNTYQVAPHVVGPQTVALSWSSLASLIDPKSIAGLLTHRSE